MAPCINKLNSASSNEVLKLSSGIDEMGEVRWPLALCLLFCWIFTFVTLVRGVKSIGKVNTQDHSGFYSLSCAIRHL